MGRPKNQLIWQHFRETENNSVTCKHCEKLYKVANLQKMARHLLKCIHCPEKSKKQISLSNSVNANKENVTPNHIVTPNETTDSNASTASNQRHLDEVNEVSKDNLHKLLAKAIYVTGSPLSMVEHPLWISFFEKLQPIYKLPSRKTISTSILDETYQDMHRELKEELLSKKYLHLQLDGWSNCRNEGIINILISKPEPVFVKSITTEENRHTSEYISEIISNVMLEYGPSKFQTVIGDNASNMQSGFRLIKQNYPNITVLNCVAHTLNLICKNITHINVINICKEMSTRVIKTIKQSQVLSSVLAKIIKEKNVGESLKLACATRWGSYCTSLKSLNKTKIALQTLAVHEKATLLPADVKASLLNEGFWKMIGQSILILEPISEAITKLESDEENIHKVYLTLKDMKSKVSFVLPDITIIEDEDKDEILTKIYERIKMCLKPIHYAAYMLDPLTRGLELNETEEGDAMEFISDVGDSIGLTIMPNLAAYRAKDGFWKRKCLWENLGEIKPSNWWHGLCGSTALGKVAERILTAPCTSAATERSFSVFSNIHSKKRNRITSERAAKITYISYNWNLLSKNDKYKNYQYEDDCACSPLSMDLVQTYDDHCEDENPPPTIAVASTSNHNATLTTEFMDCDRIVSTDLDSSDED